MTVEWDVESIQFEDRGSVSDIHCQHPTCKTKPPLRRIYWVNRVPIGSICIKKGKWNMLDGFKEDE